MSPDPTGSDVTVVIVTRDRSDELATTLRHLLELPEQPPVLVMDNGSADDTVEVARRFPDRVRVVELGTNLGCAARNVGVAMADTPLVAFSDDDSWWAPGALTKAAELFHVHRRLALLAARILVGPQNKLDAVCGEMADSSLPMESDLPGRSILGFVACGAVVRRNAYLLAGGFPGRYGIGGEEAPLALELAARGWGLAYVDDVVAHHHPSPARNPQRRRAVQHRNDLWTSWLREPPAIAVRRTWGAVLAATRDEAVRRGTWEALRGAPAVLRERQPLPAAVQEEWLQLRAG